MESETQGENLLTITDELLYVRDRGSGNVIPIPWDALAGGVVHFWGNASCLATLVKKSGCENKDLSAFTIPPGPRFQLQCLLMHLDMEKGWIRDFWIDGDSTSHFTSILFLNPENRNNMAVRKFVRRFSLFVLQQYSPIRQWAEARPLISIKDDFIRSLASMALKEERDGI